MADAVEALLGAFIVAGGLEAGFIFLKFIGLKMDYPSSEDVEKGAHSRRDITMLREHSPSQESLMSIEQDLHGIISVLIQDSTHILPLYSHPPPPAILKKYDEEGDLLAALDKVPVNVSALSEALQWQFKDRGLMLQALSHPSYTKNDLTECYQRLEFLGDAVLDYLVTCYIYEKFPTYSPGKITEMRSALVNNITFAEIAVKDLKLHKHLLYTAPALFHQISEYVNWLEMVWKKDEEESKSVILCRSISYETKVRAKKMFIIINVFCYCIIIIID